MNAAARRSRPSWRASDARVLRPELWLVAAVVVTMMLVEVWQSSRVTQLSLRLDQTRSALVQAQARLQFERAELERRSTRSELTPVATQLGLAPADARQIVNLPAEYLADAGEIDRGANAASLGTLAERVSHVLVPDATARARARN
ncbi:MAG TPA: hypothetical protein VL123_02345 [Candidatus Udaeobacter sp.]|jgi:hypothetical protein|nr:hypothetical protein [Candidatus Udaeobacter sp.]